VPIILLTAHGSIELRCAASSWAEQFLVKPLNLPALLWCWTAPWRTSATGAGAGQRCPDQPKRP